MRKRKNFSIGRENNEKTKKKKTKKQICNQDPSKTISLSNINNNMTLSTTTTSRTGMTKSKNKRPKKIIDNHQECIIPIIANNEIVPFNGFSERYYKNFIEIDEEVNERFLEFREKFKNNNANLKFSTSKKAFKLDKNDGKPIFFKGITKVIDNKFGILYNRSTKDPNTFSDKEVKGYIGMKGKINLNERFFDKQLSYCEYRDSKNKEEFMKHGCVVDMDLYLYTNFNSNRNKLHDCSKRVLNYFLIDKQWVPILSQLPIYNLSRKIATSIDMICYSIAEKRFKILEIKTSISSIFNSDSYENNFHKFLDLGMPDEKTPYTEYMRHQIQLFMQKSLFSRRYLPKGMKVDYHIVRISENGISVYNEHKFTTKEKQKIRNVCTNKKRKINKK